MVDPGPQPFVDPHYMHPMSPADNIHCRHCGDVIGVYEPLIVIVEGEAVQTSRAAAQGELAPAGPYYHASCFMRARDATDTS
jgi:hypothetical protein